MKRYKLEPVNVNDHANGQYYMAIKETQDQTGDWVRYDSVVFLEGLLAGDSIVIEDQARLLRQCRYALEQLLGDNPKLAGRVYGSTTLGNLKAELAQYRSGGKC